MTKFYVVTPEYGTVIPVCDDGTGPYEYQADLVEIEADTPRDAIALGVKWMLGKTANRDYRWCRDARSSGESPYAGVKAFPIGAEEDI